MSRLLGAAYGVFCTTLLALPLALMRAGRDVLNEGVSLGRKCTYMRLLRQSELFHDYWMSLGWNVQRMRNSRAAGFGNICHLISCHFKIPSPLQMMAKCAIVFK